MFNYIKIFFFKSLIITIVVLVNLTSNLKRYLVFQKLKASVPNKWEKKFRDYIKKISSHLLT